MIMKEGLERVENILHSVSQRPDVILVQCLHVYLGNSVVLAKQCRTFSFLGHAEFLEGQS